MNRIFARIQVVFHWSLMIAQVVLSWYFGLETVRSAITTGDVSISWMLCTFLFIVMGTMLAHGSWKTTPGVGAISILILYINAVLVYGITLSVAVLYGDWDKGDTTTMIWVVALILIILIIDRKQIGWKDPGLQAKIGMSAKSVPQLLFAFEIWERGLNPLSQDAVWVFHLLTTLRIAGVLFQKGTWNAHRRWLLVTEITNELSWCAVTAAILYNI